MREIVEFRIPEEYARRFLAPNEGKSLSGRVRVLKVPVGDPQYERIAQLNAMFQEQEGKSFFLGWRFHRYYTSQEIDSAALFHLKITAVFEPAGEECGTIYDESTACPHCGAGRRQVSDLILDLRRVPQGKDIAKTIANEWIISQRLAELLLDQGMKGFELRPVRHRARYQDDPIDPTELESGQELLQRARAAGCPYPTWPFWVWLNRPEQAPLLHQVTQEYIARKEARRKQQPSSLPTWYQLIVTSTPVKTVPPTRFGIHPFDEDREGRYKCPQGHVSGLNVLSELWVSGAMWDGSDIAQTEDMIGIRRGLLVPTPLLLISPRLYRLLRTHKIKGYQAEIAHLA